MFYVKTEYRIDYLIKKSRFIGIITPCLTEQEVSNTLHQLHQEYADASHIVFAYQLKTPTGLIYRFHDAGEPTGTAGKPIYQQLEGKHLVNVVISVVRYFGGIKLGAGGLTRAYGNTTRQLIEAAELVPYIEWTSLTLVLAYQEFSAFEYFLKKLEGRIIEQVFMECINLLIELPQQHVAQLLARYPALY